MSLLYPGRSKSRSCHLLTGLENPERSLFLEERKGSVCVERRDEPGPSSTHRAGVLPPWGSLRYSDTATTFSPKTTSVEFCGSCLGLPRHGFYKWQVVCLCMCVGVVSEVDNVPLYKNAKPLCVCLFAASRGISHLLSVSMRDYLPTFLCLVQTPRVAQSSNTHVYCVCVCVYVVYVYI